MGGFSGCPAKISKTLLPCQFAKQHSERQGRLQIKKAVQCVIICSRFRTATLLRAVREDDFAALAGEDEDLAAVDVRQSLVGKEILGEQKNAVRAVPEAFK
jgi:hypothetical protein